MNSPNSHSVSVPAEPTPEMIQAWHDRHVEGSGYIDRNSIEYALYVECYRAMLKAAPQSAGPERDGARLDLTLFVNAASIDGSDYPHQVVQKLQAALDAANVRAIKGQPQPDATSQPGGTDGA